MYHTGRIMTSESIDSLLTAMLSHMVGECLTIESRSLKNLWITTDAYTIDPGISTISVECTAEGKVICKLGIGPAGSISLPLNKYFTTTSIAHRMYDYALACNITMTLPDLKDGVSK